MTGLSSTTDFIQALTQCITAIVSLLTVFNLLRKKKTQRTER